MTAPLHSGEKWFPFANIRDRVVVDESKSQGIVANVAVIIDFDGDVVKRRQWVEDEIAMRHQIHVKLAEKCLPAVADEPGG